MQIKTATTIDEQIIRLKERGMAIADENKAKEILFDIGYYRLGFYWFPFEIGYPNKNKRTHKFIDKTTFEDAVALYYFDNDLRNILMPYLHRIEICFRTAIIYEVSNHFRKRPTWFVDAKVVNDSFISDFPKLYKDIRKNDTIKHHHKKHPNDIYAPAWKTLEYMTFGSMLFLFQNIKDKALRQKISERFGFHNLEAFENQMKTLRIMRNLCAHGHNLYDIRFPQSIKTGGLKGMDNKQRNNISGGLIVMQNLLRSISETRSKEFADKVQNLLSNPQFESIYGIIEHITLTPAKSLKSKKG